jgi:glycosyltransferase involved in cell wall biosynthesis
MNGIEVGEIVDQVESSHWASATAAVSVIVATHDRVDYLPGLFTSLAAQTAAIEVVIADDGSTDRTWAWLTETARALDLPLLALRLAHSGGPSRPRNTAATHARAPVLAITDDDCLPEPDWAAALATALGRGVGLVQGMTRPADAAHGPWDRAVDVTGPSGLFETCNLGVRREDYLGLGGFRTYAVLGRLPRGFGEDAAFGAHVARAAGFGWQPDAVVRHRWIPTTFQAHLDGVRRLYAFPWLVREVPEVADRLTARIFLSRQTAEFDMAVGAAVAAVVSPWPWLSVAAAPWVVRRLRSARRRTPSHRPRVVAERFAQEAVADAVGLAALLRGSARFRRLVL